MNLNKQICSEYYCENLTGTLTKIYNSIQNVIPVQYVCPQIKFLGTYWISSDLKLL